MRPYGWSDDKVSVVDSEADELRAMANHLVDGGALRPLAADLNERGVKTVAGGPWKTITIKRALTNPRMIGMREKNGTLVASDAEPILDADTFDKLVALFNDPARTKFARDPARMRLLSGGIVRCGLCGSQMYAVATGDPNRRDLYKCGGDTGCSRLSCNADDLEADVTEGVLARLTDAGYRKALQAAVNGLSTTQAAEEELADLRQRLDHLGEDYADGLIEREQMRAGTAKLRERIAKTKAVIERQTTLSDIPEPTVEKIIAWWEEASVQRRRDVTAVILDHVTVKPSAARTRTGIHPDRLHYEWKTA